MRFRKPFPHCQRASRLQDREQNGPIALKDTVLREEKFEYNFSPGHFYQTCFYLEWWASQTETHNRGLCTNRGHLATVLGVLPRKSVNFLVAEGLSLIKSWSTRIDEFYNYLPLRGFQIYRNAYTHTLKTWTLKNNKQPFSKNFQCFPLYVYLHIHFYMPI